MASTSIEERLAMLEMELAQIKQQLQANTTDKTIPWWQQISGVFKGSPEFDEAIRLGREWRESQRMEYDLLPDNRNQATTNNQSVPG